MRKVKQVFLVGLFCEVCKAATRVSIFSKRVVCFGCASRPAVDLAVKEVSNV